MANHLPFDTLSRLVQSRGPIAEEAAARRHVARCTRCRSELEWLQRIQGVPDNVASLGLDEGSDSLGVLRGV